MQEKALCFLESKMRSIVITWLPFRYVRRWYKIGEQIESDSAADKTNNHDVRRAQSTNNTMHIINILKFSHKVKPSVIQ